MGRPFPDRLRRRVSVPVSDCKSAFDNGFHGKSDVPVRGARLADFARRNRSAAEVRASGPDPGHDRPAGTSCSALRRRQLTAFRVGPRSSRTSPPSKLSAPASTRKSATGLRDRFHDQDSESTKRRLGLGTQLGGSRRSPRARVLRERLITDQGINQNLRTHRSVAPPSGHSSTASGHGAKRSLPIRRCAWPRPALSSPFVPFVLPPCEAEAHRSRSTGRRRFAADPESGGCLTETRRFSPA